MTLPSPKVTVQEIGAQGVAESPEVDLLALVFLPEGSAEGGLIGGRRILSAILFIACESNGFCLRTGSLGLAPLDPSKKPPPPEKRKYDPVGDWTPADCCPDGCSARIGNYNSLITHRTRCPNKPKPQK